MVRRKCYDLTGPRSDRNKVDKCGDLIRDNDICLGNIRNHLAQDYILYKLFTGNQLSNEYIEPTVAAVLFIME